MQKCAKEFNVRPPYAHLFFLCMSSVISVRAGCMQLTVKKLRQLTVTTKTLLILFC